MLVPALVGGPSAGCIYRFVARDPTVLVLLLLAFFRGVLTPGAFHRGLARVALATVGAAGVIATQRKAGKIQVSDALERHPNGVRGLCVSQELQVVPFVFRFVSCVAMVSQAAASVSSREVRVCCQATRVRKE